MISFAEARTVPSISLSLADVDVLVPPHSPVNTIIKVIEFVGYGLAFAFCVASIVFLIMFIISKVKGTENAKRNLIIFIILISIAVFIGFGVSILDAAWIQAEYIN